MGIEVVTDRVVFEDPFVSGAGVSAGIDMALALTPGPRRQARQDSRARNRVRPPAAVRRRRAGEGRREHACEISA